MIREPSPKNGSKTVGSESDHSNPPYAFLLPEFATISLSLDVTASLLTFSWCYSVGLYTGFMPASIGHLPGNTIYLLSYTYLKDVLQKREDAKHPGKVPDGRQSPWVSFVAAAGADLSAIALYCPVDVVVQRLFLQDPRHPKYAGYKDVVSSILRNEGWKGLYRGVGPIIVNSVPASAVWWTIYEECKTYFSEKIEEHSDQEGNLKVLGVPIASGSTCMIDNHTPLQNVTAHSKEPSTSSSHVVRKHAVANIAAGGVAGAIVTFLTNPLDVVRTRLQTQSMKAEAYQYTSSLHTVREMWKTEGFRAFFKGTTPRLAQWVFFSSASAFAYEFVVDVSTIKR